jgi:hypothetical protein
MTAPQRELAFGLLRAALSARGLKQTRDIMRLNETLAELTGGNFDEYGEWRYHITLMGTPSATEPWGWQLDGHHAIVNYFVLRDQVVMTPHFYGSEPVRAESGKYKGSVVMQDEQTAGWPSSTPSTSRGVSRPSSRSPRSPTTISPKPGKTTSFLTSQASAPPRYRRRSASSCSI